MINYVTDSNAIFFPLTIRLTLYKLMGIFTFVADGNLYYQSWFRTLNDCFGAGTFKKNTSQARVCWTLKILFDSHLWRPEGPNWTLNLDSEKYHKESPAAETIKTGQDCWWVPHRFVGQAHQIINIDVISCAWKNMANSIRCSRVDENPMHHANNFMHLMA